MWVFCFDHQDYPIGQPNHKVLLDKTNGEARFKCSVLSKAKWPLVIASRYNIPYLLPKQGHGHVSILCVFHSNCHLLLQQIRGEIYEVDDQMLKFLDEFEGHPGYYRRERISVTSVEKNETLEPFVYFLTRYKQSMLELPLLTNYDSYGEHGRRYVERCRRQGAPAQAVATRNELKLNSNDFVFPSETLDSVDAI